MRKSVTQEHGMGCAVACVAYSRDISYKVAHKRFSRLSGAWTNGYKWREVAKAADFDYCYLKPSKKHLLKVTGTIVYVVSCRKYPFGHYLVRTDNGWMNPWINNPVIHPAKSGFQKKLPGRAACAIFKP